MSFYFPYNNITNTHQPKWKGEAERENGTRCIPQIAFLYLPLPGFDAKIEFGTSFFLKWIRFNLVIFY